ncbi:MAG TPA: hypothetical protein VMT00_01105 [Thermoanaerobaculia bacterium]|nr:hypothetical protein [Thermoanaerobaculia bacterium]
MAYDGNVRVLVCCHYYGLNLLEDQGLLEPALRSKGYRGRIVAVETKQNVPNEPAAVAEAATSHMRESGWMPALDTFVAMVGSFPHSIVVYGAGSDVSAAGPQASRTSNIAVGDLVKGGILAMVCGPLTWYLHTRGVSVWLLVLTGFLTLAGIGGIMSGLQGKKDH